MSSLKIGDKVEILRMDIPSNLRKKSKPLLGRITNINGYYIMVRPKYQRHDIELYQNELKQIL